MAQQQKIKFLFSNSHSAPRQLPNSIWYVGIRISRWHCLKPPQSDSYLTLSLKVSCPISYHNVTFDSSLPLSLYLTPVTTSLSSMRFCTVPSTTFMLQKIKPNKYRLGHWFTKQNNFDWYLYNVPNNRNGAQNCDLSMDMCTDQMKLWLIWFINRSSWMQVKLKYLWAGCYHGIPLIWNESFQY